VQFTRENYALSDSFGFAGIDYTGDHSERALASDIRQPLTYAACTGLSR